MSTYSIIIVIEQEKNFRRTKECCTSTSIMKERNEETR